MTSDIQPGLQQPNWYAARTRSRHEKRVVQHLQAHEVECFLPLYASIRRWKDRRVKLDLPLFPGYLFVRLQLQDRLQVLQAPGVVGLVMQQGRPAPVPLEQIDSLRTAVGGESRLHPHPYLSAGRKVRIRSGAFEGITGILLRTKNDYRVVLSIDVIKRSVCVEVDSADLELL